MMDVQVALSQADILNVTGRLHLTPKAVRAAAMRAIRKSARSIQAESARKLSAELRLQQKLVRARLRLYRKGEGLQQKVWLGLNAMAAARLGAVRKVRGGTRAGRYFFKDAFPIDQYGGGLYRRTGKERFPLELVKLEIEEAGRAAVEQAAERGEERFLHFLRQEIRYELLKLTGKLK